MMVGPRRSLVVGSALLLTVLSACSSQPSSTPASHSSQHSTSPMSSTPSSGKKSNAPAPTSHATEFSPPGDIPDNTVYVDYRVPSTKAHIKVPEGFARSSNGGRTTFTDHYNSIAISVVKAAKAPTVASAKHNDVPKLRKTVSKFAPGHVTKIARTHGPAILVTYQLDSKPNPVTGKVVRDAAERYEFWLHGQEAILTLTGPTNADNVDPWRLVSDSLRWQ